MEQSHPNPIDVRQQAGMIDAVLKLQIKPPGQQQIVKTSTQQQQILQLKTGGHKTEVHIGAAVVAPHRTGAVQQRCLHQAGPESSIPHPALHQISQLLKHRAVAINN